MHSLLLTFFSVGAFSVVRQIEMANIELCEKKKH